LNILIFGPNGSGKGTQSDLIKDQCKLEHIESGDIFRGHIKGGTELGLKAREFIDKGELVPDEITIPMVLETLNNVEAEGWLLDGFPRNVAQAKSLLESLSKAGENLDFVVELELDREIAKNRIMGRRICTVSPHHPNNIFIEAIKPNGENCRVCGSDLSVRPDDQDEKAINKRHDIYYDTQFGTMAAARYFTNNCSAKHILIEANRSIEEIKSTLLQEISS
jgi:adenylate kinase